jgi:phosphotransferase system HPr (HPr) family protein
MPRLLVIAHTPLASAFKSVASHVYRNKLGLHARASAKLTKLAGSFQSEVHLSRNGRRVNAKSIMGVMMLAAGMGSRDRDRDRRRRRAGCDGGLARPHRRQVRRRAVRRALRRPGGLRGALLRYIGS